ncbi:MAG: 16S rRNA (adenine(1518)-N(6)/adenine(1519)-N(6))-dimethyltransferase RsmA [Firmicutes bacterium]|nr:16S rRNA (adenine(1518)-N(6)/adenine(1519)-N(6))-dimethyltransferase RsmA [Bacillota bacterium]
MDRLTDRGTVRALLRRYGLRPRKALGQHFMVSDAALGRLLEAAELDRHDVVVEVGPGLGTLTGKLAERVRLVIALELDRALLEVLAETCTGRPVAVVRGDALAVNLDDLVHHHTGGEYGRGGRPYKVVANLPYYITGPFLGRLVRENRFWSTAVLTVQLEVARRLVARPGTKEYGALTLLVAYHAEVEVVGRIPPGAFYPPPEVTSAIVRLRRRERPPVEVRDAEGLFRLVRMAFGRRRKTILNALAGADGGASRCEWQAVLERAGIDPVRRGESLSLAEFARLAEAVYCGRGWHCRATDQSDQRKNEL